MNTSSAEIFIPFSVAEKLQDRNFFMRIEGLFANPQTALEGEEEVRFVLRRMRGIAPGDRETFRVAAIDKFIEQFKTLAAGITAIAGGFGAVFGVPIAVAINHFISDTDAEIQAVIDYCRTHGVEAFRCTHWAEGGKGTEDEKQELLEVPAGHHGKDRHGDDAGPGKPARHPLHDAT